MAFLETPRFPDDISEGSQGGPGYQTAIARTQGGFEQRNANWDESLHQYNVAYGVRTEAQMYALLEFFHAVKGRLDGFRFKDFDDFQSADPMIVPTQNDQPLGTGVADGTAGPFQMNKRYVAGVNQTNRTVRKPISGTILIGVNGGLQTETVDYTIDYTTGLVTFITIPANLDTITWGGEFDVPVRFDQDALQTDWESFNVRNANASITELRQ